MIRIPNNIFSFAQDKVDIYKAFADLMCHYRSMKGETGLEFDKGMSFDEKSDKLSESVRNEIARLAGVSNFSQFAPEVWAQHPLYKFYTFAVVGALVDTVLPDTIIDSIGMYTDVRVGGFGDNFAFDCKPRDLFVVSAAGRGKRRSEVHKQFEGQVTITPFEHDITVQVSLYKVLAGKENLAEFAMKAVRSIETQMTLDAYSAFDTYVTALGTTPANGALKVAGYSQDAAVQLASIVTAYNQGEKAVFVGTQIALSKILPDNSTNYRMQIDSEYVKIGYIRNAFGYDTMVLPQVANWGTPFSLSLDNTHIYVMSPAAQKPVKLCIEGATITISDDTNANANLTQSTTMKKSWNTGIATNSVCGIITLP